MNNFVEPVESIQTNLEQLNQALEKIRTNRIKSKELASALNANRYKVVAILKKLENKKIVKQIKVGKKLASIWEIEPTLIKVDKNTDSPLASLVSKQVVTRQEFFQLLDQLYAELNEIKGQLIIANQSLEVVKTYWQRLYKLDTNRLGTAFDPTKNSSCT